MTTIRTIYLDTAEVVAGQLRDPAVAAAWDAPSALAQMTVGALAAHLARQLFSVQQLLASPAADQQPIGLLEHYARSAWPSAGLEDAVNVAIRDSSQDEAAGGPAALADRAAAAVATLRRVLPAEAADRVVFLPWGPWALTLDDMLVTRLMEIAVHSDDLAYSVASPAPDLPAEAIDVAVTLLARLAVRKHGGAAVLRALSRAERAPAVIAAF